MAHYTLEVEVDYLLNGFSAKTTKNRGKTTKMDGL